MLVAGPLFTEPLRALICQPTAVKAIARAVAFRAKELKLIVIGRHNHLNSGVLN